MNLVAKFLFFGILSLSFCFAYAKEQLEARGRLYDQIFFEKGMKYNLPPDLLKGIGRTESGFKVDAVNVNSNGTIDRGIMQINSVHLNGNLNAEDLFDPYINIEMGAKILRACIDKHGMTYRALNCYNGKLENNSYNVRVFDNIVEGYFPGIYISRKPSNPLETRGRIIKR